MCSHRAQEGLIFRKMFDFNQVMVMNLGWALVNNLTSFGLVCYVGSTGVVTGLC